MLLPYRVHRLGLTEGIAEAQAAVGTVGNPVTGLAVQGDQLVVTFEDGSTDALDLPAGQDAEDQTARDAAAAAQSEIDAHERATHNTDTTARSTARNAQQTAEQAQTGLETHEASTHNTDAGARTAAANAQSAVEDHERTTHNTDQTARDAAAAAQSAAEEAGGQPPTMLYEAATAAIPGSTGLITGNVVCPDTGYLEPVFPIWLKQVMR